MAVRGLSAYYEKLYVKLNKFSNFYFINIRSPSAHLSVLYETYDVAGHDFIYRC